MDYLLEEYFMTIEIDKNNIHLSDNGIYDLLIHYAEKNRTDDFKKLYLQLYEEAPILEIGRCYFFIRFTLGLLPEPRY